MILGRLSPKLLRRASLAVLVLLLFLVVWVGSTLSSIASMPGASYAGPLEPWTPDDHSLGRQLESRVQALTDFGPRAASDREARHAAGTWLLEQLQQSGLSVSAESFEPVALPLAKGKAASQAAAVPALVFTNYIVSLGGPPGAPLLVVSAHYDTVPGSMGADDDASGVAALLELADRFASNPMDGAGQRYRVQFCFFDGEEAGYQRMGSGFHAGKLKEQGQEVAGMISLEMLGYFTDAPDSQTFPSPALGPLYPDAGNFIAFVGSEASGDFIRRAIGVFRDGAKFPSEGLVAPDSIRDVRRSDHVHFVDHGWPGFMVTDTANFRYPHYHRATDTPDRLDYLALARITRGLEGMIRTLAAR